jgi:VanZ family protein
MAQRHSFSDRLRAFARRHALSLAVLWTLGILVALTIPTPGLPEAPATIDLDKVAHAVLFVGLGVLWMHALQPSSGDTPRHARRRGAGLFLAGVFFAGLTEVYQYVLPIERLGDPYDALADVVGLALAILGYIAYRTVQHQRRASS